MAALGNALGNVLWAQQMVWGLTGLGSGIIAGSSVCLAFPLCRNTVFRVTELFSDVMSFVNTQCQSFETCKKYFPVKPVVIEPNASTGLFDLLSSEGRGALLSQVQGEGATLIKNAIEFFRNETQPALNQIQDQIHQGELKFKEIVTKVEAMPEKVANEMMKNLDKVQQTFFNNMIYFLTVITGIGIVGLAAQLGLQYLHAVAIKELSQPKLATEVKYVNTRDWMRNNMSDLIGKSMTYVLPAFAMGATAAYKTRILWSSYVNDQFKQIGTQFNLGYEEESLSWFSQIGVSAGIGSLGGLAGCVYIAYQVYQKCKIEASVKNKAVFSPELGESIDNISKATRSLKENGGFFQNVLLYGPGGTGKTMVSKIIAENSEMNYVKMSGGDLAQFIGNKTHVTELNRLFMSVKNCRSPTIILVDEAESLCQHRSRLVDKQEYMQLLNGFLSWTGTESKQFMLILATNRPEDLDPVVLSRMDHLLFVGPPAAPERKRILQEYLPQFFNEEEITQFFSEESLDAISKQTEGLTGRALFKMVNAMFGNKNVAKDKILTDEVIQKTVKHFVTQEKRMAAEMAKGTVASPGTNNGILNLITNMFQTSKEGFPRSGTVAS